MFVNPEDKNSSTNRTEEEIMLNTTEYLSSVVLTMNVVMPPMYLLGVVGNILCLVVLTRPQMVNPTSCFLIALAVSDLLMIITPIPNIFGNKLMWVRYYWLFG